MAATRTRILAIQRNLPESSLSNIEASHQRILIDNARVSARGVSNSDRGNAALIGWFPLGNTLPRHNRACFFEDRNARGSIREVDRWSSGRSRDGNSAAAIATTAAPANSTRCRRTVIAADWRYSTSSRAFTAPRGAAGFVPPGVSLGQAPPLKANAKGGP